MLSLSPSSSSKLAWEEPPRFNMVGVWERFEVLELFEFFELIGL